MKKHLILTFLFAFSATFAVFAQTPGRMTQEVKNVKHAKPTKSAKHAKATPGGVAKAKARHDRKLTAAKKHKAHKTKAAPKKMGATGRPAHPVIQKPEEPTPARPVDPKTDKMSTTKPSNKAQKLPSARPPFRPKKISPQSGSESAKDAKMAPGSAKDAKMQPNAAKPTKATPGSVARAKRDKQ